MGFQAPPGVYDIIPGSASEPWKEVSRWQYVEALMREEAEAFGYREIRTPIFERTELFTRSVGTGTAIVSNEMYTFVDKGERSLTLRPEGTASVVRAACENRLLEGKNQKFYYFGPMFRYERMQAGRYRQFYHFGLEAYGNGGAEQDAEIIDFAHTLFWRLGIRNLKIKINSIGDKEARETYKKAFLEYLRGHFDQLSEESRKRFEANPLRVLDSKDPQDKAIVNGAPSILDFLSEECRTHFERLQTLLKEYEIPFEIDPRLVRGLDYYQKTVFEILSEDLGAQNALCGGGRYDGLAKELGGPDVPCSGFALGIERVLQTMLKQETYFPPPKAPLLYFIPIGGEALEWCLSKAHELRRRALSCEVDIDGRKVGKGFARAADMGATWACAVGSSELDSHRLELKELATGTKMAISIESLERILQIEKDTEPFMSLFQRMYGPFKTAEEKAFFLQRIEDRIAVTRDLTDKLKQAMVSLKDYL